MSRKNSASLVYLLIFGAIAYPFVWLYQQIGALGFLATGVLLGAGIVYFAKRQANEDRNNFEQIVRYVFDNRLPPEEARQINARLARSSERARLIRHLQILRDSIDIFSASRNPDTAQSRFDLALNHYQAAKHMLPRFVSTSTIAHIDESFTKSSFEFQTTRFTNPASELISKSKTLKTRVARAKRLEAAQAILSQGLAAKDSDKAVVGAMRDQVNALISELDRKS